MWGQALVGVISNLPVFIEHLLQCTVQWYSQGPLKQMDGIEMECLFSKRAWAMG